MDNFRNTELGTRRNQRTLAAMEASHVLLDDSSPMDLLRDAIALAKQLRFVSDDAPGASWSEVLQSAKADWSGFLGEIDGEVYVEFQQFFADPEGYIPLTHSPLAQPHVALFGAFLHILHHARTEINAFAQRHFDHYLFEELGLKPLPAQPASVYVTAQLKADAPATILPGGSRLLAPDLDDTLALETEGDLEVHQGTLAQIASVRARFESAGFLKKLDPLLPDGGMAAIRAMIWQQGYQTRLAAGGWTSFEGILASLSDRARRRDFPADVLQVSLDDFRRMMGLNPTALPLTPSEDELLSQWEALYARMIICKAYPQEKDALPAADDSLVRKLSVVLFNGAALPPYKGHPLDLNQLQRDATQWQSAADATAALAYIAQVLFLDEADFLLLCDLNDRKQSGTKTHPALVKAMVAKAATLAPDLLRRRLMQVAGNEDATQIQRRAGGWFPYGKIPEGNDRANLGLIIESPILAMAEGDRQVVLTLDFAPLDFAMLTQLFDLRAPVAGDWYSPFSFFVSTEKEWLEVSWRKVAPQLLAATQQVAFTLDLPANLPSVTGPGPKFEDALLVGKGPMLNLRLAAPNALTQSGSAMPHDLFCQSLRLHKVHIAVKVDGLREFLAENQFGTLKTSSPFEPFGSSPGPSAQFMLAHPEICLKQLDYLDLKLEWMGLPADIGQYYDPYFVKMGSSPAITDKPHQKADFRAALELVTGRWTTQLGAGDVAFLESSLHLSTSALKPITEHYAADAPASWGSPSNWPRYFRLTYNLDWDAQQEYDRASRRLTTALTAASNSFAVASMAYSKAPNDVVEGKTNTQRYNEASSLLTSLSSIALQPPFVPKLKQLSLGYSAHVEIPLLAWDPDPQRRERLYHPMPFGHQALPIANGTPQPLIPHFEHEGSVMLGFDKLDGTEALSLLVTVQQGSGNPDALPPAVEWSYYGQTGWRQLPSHYIYQNETNGLTQTGLLRLMLPPDVQRSVADMPRSLHWIMASVPSHSADLPDWVALHLHALRARQVPGSATKAGLWQVPSGSVNVTQRPFPTIERIAQPFASLDGRPAEPVDEFYRRVSERLRHKNRVVTAWDYEHLCLEQFSSLFAVKTIPAIAAEGRLPGELTVVVVPDLRKAQFSDIFQPRLGYGELNEISRFLSQRGPAFARIAARNPIYRPVAVGTTLNFKEGYSAAACKHRIEQRLQEYLAPWAFDKSTEMAFGGRLYVSEIVDFLQSEPYVGFVGKTRLFVGDGHGIYTEAIAPDGDSSAYIEVESTDVITTAPSHLVNAISEENAQNEIWQGISWMVIHSDFKVALDPNPAQEIYEEWDGISWVVIGRDLSVSETIVHKN